MHLLDYTLDEHLVEHDCKDDEMDKIYSIIFWRIFFSQIYIFLDTK